MLSRPLGFTHSKPSNHNNGLLQFRNDSGFLPTRVGKAGVLRYTWTQGTQKSACTERGLLISVRSGVNTRAVAAAHQSSRSGSRRVPIGIRPAGPVHCTELCTALHLITARNLITLSTTGHRRNPTVVQRPPVHNLACSQQSSCGCATSPRTAIEAPQTPSTQTPEEGRPGRNDSRCAGITK